MLTRFFNGKVIKNGTLLFEDLWVKEGIIVEAPASKADREIDLQQKYLAPGYIDLQINGGFGVDFTTNLAGAEKVAKELLKYGVTAFLPTLISTSPERYQEQVPYFTLTSGDVSGAAMLGLHLEGPFLNPDYSGAHSLNFLKNFSHDTLNSVYGSLEKVKMITLAPELPGALDAIKTLRRNGIVVSLGHTNANEIELQQGIDAGAIAITHLFNAMASFHHRKSSVMGEVLAKQKLFFSLIADGVHLHQTAIQLAWKMHSKGLFLVSDAVALWGIEKPNAFLGSLNILSNAKQAYVAETGRLAGGLNGIDFCVRFLRMSTGCSIPYAIEAASTKPAHILGIEKSLGSLNIGCKANMIVLNDKLEVQETFINGISAFRSDLI